MSQPEEIFAAATAAKTGTFFLGAEEVARVVVYGLASGDTVDAQVPNLAGTTWTDMYDANGQVQFEYQVTNTLLFVGPGHFKLDKGSTTGTVGAYLQRGTPK